MVRYTYYHTPRGKPDSEGILDLVIGPYLCGATFSMDDSKTAWFRLLTRIMWGIEAIARGDNRPPGFQLTGMHRSSQVTPSQFKEAFVAQARNWWGGDETRDIADFLVLEEASMGQRYRLYWNRWNDSLKDAFLDRLSAKPIPNLDHLKCNKTDLDSIFWEEIPWPPLLKGESEQ